MDEFYISMRNLARAQTTSCEGINCRFRPVVWNSLRLRVAWDTIENTWCHLGHLYQQMTNYDQRGNTQTLNWLFVWKKPRIKSKVWLDFLTWLRWRFREFELSKNALNIDPQNRLWLIYIHCSIYTGNILADVEFRRAFVIAEASKRTDGKRPSALGMTNPGF